VLCESYDREADESDVDTLKRYTVAHGHKVISRLTGLPSDRAAYMLCSLRSIYSLTILQTTNLIINLDHDDWILDDPNKTLADLGMGMSLYLIYTFPWTSVISPTNR